MENDADADALFSHFLLIFHIFFIIIIFFFVFHFFYCFFFILYFTLAKSHITWKMEREMLVVTFFMLLMQNSCVFLMQGNFLHFYFVLFGGGGGGGRARIASHSFHIAREMCVLVCDFLFGRDFFPANIFPFHFYFFSLIIIYRTFEIVY